MARIGDLPQPLRPCGHEIPKDILLRLPRWEVVTRCASAQSLYDRAQDEPDDVAEKTRVLAGRALTALPVEEYLARLAYFYAELQTASRGEDDEAAARAFIAILKLQRENPMPPNGVVAIARPDIGAEMAFGHRAASRAAHFARARQR